MTRIPKDALLDRLERLLGPRGAVRPGADQAPFLTDWRDRWRGETPLVCLPASTEETAAVVRLCAEAKTAIVPQSGATGLVGGHLPMGGAILLSTRRMDAIEEADAAGFTLAAQSGAILQNVQAAAAAAGRLFPLSLASEGSARIGGLIATNAGGVHVIRYGVMRDQVLGLEAVLPDGRVFDGLSRLRKDNTGYDLKHLLIGSEGTLGVITRAVLRLAPRPRESATAMAALGSPKDALALLARLQDATGGGTAAFELMPRFGVALAVAYGKGVRDPFAAPPPWRVLIEVHGLGARKALEETLAASLETGEATDAVIPESVAQTKDLWRMREALSEVQKHAGASVKHDVSVPVAAVPAFLGRAAKAAERVAPGARPCFFGHVGDGNIHANVTRPEAWADEVFLARRETMASAIHDVARALDGSISAEHGIGRAKREALARHKDPTALSLMRAVKAAIDPDGIMNPGVLL